MENAGQFFDVEDWSIAGELASAVASQHRVSFSADLTGRKAVQVGGVVLLEGADRRVEPALGLGRFRCHRHQADLYFIPQLGALLADTGY